MTDTYTITDRGAAALESDVVREIEDRAGVEALGDLQARRRKLLKTLAPLAALHGPGGKWDAKRKQLLEAMKVRARMTLTANGAKVTDGAVEAHAYADEQYERFVDDGIKGHIEYIAAANEATELDERIESRKSELYAWGKEAGLTR